MQNYDVLWWAVLLNILSIIIPVAKKSNRQPLSHYLGFPCWIVQTLTLTQIIGYTTLHKSKNPQVVLCCLITTVVFAGVCALIGGLLLKC